MNTFKLRMDPYPTVEQGEVTVSMLMKHLEENHPEYIPAATQTTSRSQSIGNAGKANVPWNQPFCEHLKVLADKYRSDHRREKLSHTLDRARRNIMAIQHELRSKQDFLAVKGVGPYVCRELEEVLNQLNGNSSSSSDTLGKPKKSKNQTTTDDTTTSEPQPKAKRKARTTSKKENLAAVGVSPEGVNVPEPILRSMSLQVPKPVRTAEMAALARSSSLNAVSTLNRTSGNRVETISLLDSPVEKKQRLVRNVSVSSSAGEVTSSSSSSLSCSTTSLTREDQSSSSLLQRSNSLNSEPGLKRVRTVVEGEHCESSSSTIVDSLEGGEVVLLLDSREIGSKRERHFFENKLRNEMGINVEVRGLPVGDVMWMIRSSSGKEFVCDTIIERKTADDLGTSIKDGRYKEQQSRLLEVGMDRRIYLLEGDIRKITETIPISALETAIRNTRLMGFVVSQTANRDATCEFLARVHRTVQNKFQANVYRATEFALWSSFQDRAKYQQCETVGEVFQAMLVQIPGCSSEKATAIAALYPTPRALAQAYLDPAVQLADPEQERKRRAKLLEDIQCGVSRRRLGPKLSMTIAKLICAKDYSAVDARGEDADDEEGE